MRISVGKGIVDYKVVSSPQGFVILKPRPFAARNLLYCGSLSGCPRTARFLLSIGMTNYFKCHNES